MNSIFAHLAQSNPQSELLERLTKPFCWVRLSRYDSDEPGGRLEDCLIFVCGRAGKEVIGSVIELVDCSGILTVSSTRSLKFEEKEAFRDAWSEMGNEPRENVEFVSRQFGEEPD